MTAATLLAAAALAFGAQADLLGFNTLGEKPFGVLLLGEGGDRDWKAQVDLVKKHASRTAMRYPLEFAPGLADRRSIQKAIDALHEQKARLIVVVPLFVSSHGEVMDQNRYLLGVNEKPSTAAYFKRVPATRVKSPVPLVIGKALDDHPLFVELLANRAKAHSREPAKEAVLLVGEAPEQDEKAWTASAAALAEKVRQKGAFAAAGAYGLRLNGTQADREKSRNGLRGLAKEMGRGERHVIVVPLTLHSRLKLAQALDGLFVKQEPKGVLPDPRIEKWVEETAVAASKLPDMRMFKDAAKAGIVPAGLRRDR